LGASKTCRVPCRPSAKYQTALVCEATTQVQGKALPKGEEAIPEVHTDGDEFRSLPTRVQKHHKSWCLK
jgi:hypothetical protein